MRHLPIAWTALLLLVSDPRSLGAQPCPENGFWANRVGHAEWFSSAPIYTSPGGELSYNLITGSLEASLFGGFIEISQRMTVEEFPISVSIGLVTGRVRAFAAGVLTFANLPPGYSIQSCQGYTGTPVPVARRTWGAIKQLYR